MRRVCVAGSTAPRPGASSIAERPTVCQSRIAQAAAARADPRLVGPLRSGYVPRCSQPPRLAASGARWRRKRVGFSEIARQVGEIGDFPCLIRYTGRITVAPPVQPPQRVPPHPPASTLAAARAEQAARGPRLHPLTASP